MTKLGSNKEDTLSQIMYIKQNVSELNFKECVGVLQILLHSDIDDQKISEKGGGTQIKYKDIPQGVVESIYNFIKQKIEEKTANLTTHTKEKIVQED